MSNTNTPDTTLDTSVGHSYTTSYGSYSNSGQHVSGQGCITNIHEIHRVRSLHINAGQWLAITEADTAVQIFMLKNIAPKAIHDANNTGLELPKCYPGTREAIQRDLSEWVERTERKYPIAWIYAPAGSGKTAIAKTLADSFSNPPKRYLLATFFFRRTSPNQNTEERFIATIAYQIKTNLPQTSRFIADAIQADMAIFQRDLLVQMDKLILDPLSKACETVSVAERATWPRLLVIDGLDECSGRDAQCKILDAISHLVRYMPFPLALFLSCRPESHIRRAFQGEQLSKVSSKTCLSHAYSSDHDLHTFFVGRFEEVVKAHSHILKFPQDWPGKEVIDHLIAMSSGQFIYASTVMKYIDAEDDHPMERLDVVRGLEKSLDDENPFAALDSLYRHILASVKPKHLPTVIRVLQVTLSQFAKIGPSLGCLTGLDLAPFLGLDPGKLAYSMGNLEGILIESEISTSTHTVWFYHASFRDFLLDESRSGPYFIDISFAHTQLILHLFPLIWNDDGTVPSRVRTVIDRLPFAAMTEELCRTLYRLKETTITRKLIQNCLLSSKALWSWIGWNLVRDLANGLGELLFNDALALKHDFLKEVGNYVSEELQNYTEEPLCHLIPLFMIDCSINSGHDFGPCWPSFDSFILSRFCIDDHILQLDSTSLNLQRSLWDRFILKQDWDFLRQLIRDSDYSIKPEAYAATCLCVLNCITDLSPPIILPSDAQFRDLARVVSSSLKDIERYLESAETPNERPDIHPEALALWHVFCHLGEPLLGLAGPSVELQNCLKENERTIYLFSHMDHDESRRKIMWKSIKDAIDRYLLHYQPSPSTSVDASLFSLQQLSSGGMSMPNLAQLSHLAVHPAGLSLSRPFFDVPLSSSCSTGKSFERL